MPTRFMYDAAIVEALDENTRTRDLVLRMAGLVRTGRLEPFVRVVSEEPSARRGHARLGARPGRE